MATRSKRLRGAALTTDAHSGDFDFPLHADPSLMTERQQLAFLLRKTAQGNAQDAPSSQESNSSASERESSDDDESPTRRTTKKPRRVKARSPKSPQPPAASREDLIAAALKNPAGLVLYCGRGRPPKNAIKLAPGEVMSPDLKKLVETAANHLRRNTSRDAMNNVPAKPKEKDADKENHQANNNTRDKPRPSSSTREFRLRDVFEDHHHHHGDFGRAPPPCALCCGFDSPMDALFLCPTCDRKYPTQRALGLV